jgi:hypothetical protein
MTGCLPKKIKQSYEFLALQLHGNKAAIEETKKTEIQFICLFTNLLTYKKKIKKMLGPLQN